MSCAYDISMITIQDARKLAERYGLKVHVPSKLYKVHKPPRFYVTVLESFLKFGLLNSLGIG